MCYRSKAGGFCLHLFKAFLRFLISHVGLLLLIVAYSLLGAFTYRQIEGSTTRSQTLTEIRRPYVERLWKLTEDLNVLNETEWLRIADDEFHHFQERLIIYTERDPYRWTFAKSLLCAVSVVTTIGYGDESPKTRLGRVFTIVYATLGVPLVMICLVNTGKLLASCFRLLYGSVLRMRRYGIRKCHCTKLECCRGSRCCGHAYEHGQVVQNFPGLTVHFESGVIDESSLNPSDVQVPWWICLLIITIYMLLGSILFSHWEGWSYFESFYFCFVTLSTIGLGDFIPGNSLGTDESQAQAVFCAFYLLIGLTLLAMCFNLLQDQIKKIFQTIGANVHLFSKENESS